MKVKAFIIWFTVDGVERGDNKITISPRKHFTYPRKNSFDLLSFKILWPIDTNNSLHAWINERYQFGYINGYN